MHSSTNKSSTSSSSSNNDVSTIHINEKEKEKHIKEFNFPFCDEASKYECLNKIGQGAFGVVFKARKRKGTDSTGFVAMKKVLIADEKEGFPVTALREIKILQQLKHRNVINLIEICRTKASSVNKFKSTVFLVLEFCDHDLSKLLANKNVIFSLGGIKNIMQQLFNGLYFIHSSKILHRDMKPANILITKGGTLKLSDFGLARAIHSPKNGQLKVYTNRVVTSWYRLPELLLGEESYGLPVDLWDAGCIMAEMWTEKSLKKYTNRVVTLWYRPPELLLGEQSYGPPVDLWGAGCVMAEMWTRSPILPGRSEQHQLTLISQLCGSIKPEVWPDVQNLKLFNKIELPKHLKRKVKEHLKRYVRDPLACDLLDKLLILDPSKRVDAATALNHAFFWTDPMPNDVLKMWTQRNGSTIEYTGYQDRVY